MLTAPLGGIALEYVRRAVGPQHVIGGAVVCRAANGYPLEGGFRMMAVEELGT